MVNGLKTEKLTDKALAVAIPTAFLDLFPDAWKHDDKRGPGNRIGLYCSKCKIEYTQQNDELGKPCTVPTPIDVTDLGKAMEVFRGIANNAIGLSPERHFKITEALLQAQRDIHAQYTCADATPDWDEDMRDWVQFQATPQQIWRICLLAKGVE